MDLGVHIHSSGTKGDWCCQYHLVGSVCTTMGSSTDRYWNIDNNIHCSCNNYNVRGNAKRRKVRWK